MGRRKARFWIMILFSWSVVGPSKRDPDRGDPAKMRDASAGGATIQGKLHTWPYNTGAAYNT